MLETAPGLRPISIMTEMLRRHRDFPASAAHVHLEKVIEMARGCAAFTQPSLYF
jgi:hypothetical protein